jgi:NTP pyrophosphatase (non-canonical NTP hydrolase)
MNKPGRARVVICGTFRREQGQLRSDHAAFVELGCEVLSPRDVGFVDEVEGFVLASDERGRWPGDIEADHLGAMERADLVWLHCPRGYLGRSAAMELGFAQALGLRVFGRTIPDDVALSGFVRQALSPMAALKSVEAASGEAPSRPIVALQRYYERMARLRGWEEESPEETLSLLEGELAELDGALQLWRRAPDDPKALEDAGLELADIQLYVVHMANVLGLDLGTAVAAKELLNADRFESVPQPDAA